MNSIQEINEALNLKVNMEIEKRLRMHIVNITSEEIATTLDRIARENTSLKEKLKCAESVINKMDCDCGFDNTYDSSTPAVCFRCEALSKIRGGK